MDSMPAMDTITATCPTVHQNGTAHRESQDSRPATPVLRLHFYHSSQGADKLSFPPGDYVAEELCVEAAKACSEYLSSATPHKIPASSCFANMGHRSQDKVIKRPQ